VCCGPCAPEYVADVRLFLGTDQAVSELRKSVLSKRISERLWMHMEGSAALGVAFFRQDGECKPKTKLHPACAFELVTKKPNIDPCLMCVDFGPHSFSRYRADTLRP